MNKDYVAQYRRIETTHWWFLVRQKIIAQAIQKYIAPENIPLKILNVGAASGWSSQWLSAFGKVVSAENDQVFFDFLSAEKMDVVHASITRLPFGDNSFDVVCALDVIEHVQDDVKAMNELMRVCKPGGKICITVPSCKALWSAHDEVNNHFRRYNKSGLTRLIDSKRDAVPVYTTCFNTILFPLIFITRKIEKLFRKNAARQKSDFDYYKTSRWISYLLQKVFGIEIFLLRFIRFPFGVSLLAIAGKRKDERSG